MPQSGRHDPGARWAPGPSSLPRAALAACLLMAASVRAETRALLVGVSGYPNLPPEYRLEGPRNDVQLVSAMLRARGVRDVVVLADGVAGASGLPTLGAIRTQFERLLRAARPGDWTVIYLSGHGSQLPQPQPVPPGAWREPDGKDEIFLPYDVADWEEGRKATKALVDDEIGVEIRGLMRRGSSVWAIFDACHAGDMDKMPAAPGATRQRRIRYVPPSVLGIPPTRSVLPVPDLDPRQTGAARAAGNFWLGEAQAVAKALPGDRNDVAGSPPFDADEVSAARGTARRVHAWGLALPAAELPKQPALATTDDKAPRLVAFFAAQSDEFAAEDAVWRIGGQLRVAGLYTWQLTQLMQTYAGQTAPRFGDLAQRIRERFRASGQVLATPGMEGPGELALPF